MQFTTHIVLNSEIVGLYVETECPGPWQYVIASGLVHTVDTERAHQENQNHLKWT